MTDVSPPRNRGDRDQYNERRRPKGGKCTVCPRCLRSVGVFSSYEVKSYRTYWKIARHNESVTERSRVCSNSGVHVLDNLIFDN